MCDWIHYSFRFCLADWLAVDRLVCVILTGLTNGFNLEIGDYL